MLVDNIVFLKKHNPELYKAISQLNGKADNQGISLEDTKSQDKTIKITRNGQDLYLHSRYDPRREAAAIINKVAEKEKITEDSHVIFYGLGLGYHIEEFVNKYPRTSFSLYEPSPLVFSLLLQQLNLEKLPLRNLEMLECQYQVEVADNFLRRLLQKITKKIVIIELPVYQNAFAEEYADFMKKFSAAIRATRSDLHTNYFFQKRWIINSINNFSAVLNTPNIILEKKGEFKGKTAILVAAGPSLNEEIENLRYIKEQGLAYIFTVGSAINTLVHHGIYPDATCSIDPGVHNQEVIKIIKEKGIKDIPLFFGSTVGYETLLDYPGKMYHMVTSQDTVASFYLKNSDDQSINIVYDAPTVAIATLQLLYILGFSRIILVGQNLGFIDKLRYAAGIPYDRELSGKRAEGAFWVEDVYGGKILTDTVYDLMRRQLEQVIAQLPAGMVINTTKGGAAIKGAEFVELKTLIGQSLGERVVVDNWLEGNKTNYAPEHLAAQAKSMDKSYEEAVEIIKDYRKVLERISMALNNKNYLQAEKLYPKLDRELRRIERNRFYKTFILPMNRVSYKILADNIDVINEIKNPQEKGQRIVSSFAAFYLECQQDMQMMKEFYSGLNDAIREFCQGSEERDAE
ncbi:MAG: 6-hydroxymethylpterin diphosphokinase MptE-like protein [Peptococcia bacterium]